MSPTRRDFIRTTAAGAAAVAAYGTARLGVVRTGRRRSRRGCRQPLEIANEALNAARKAGASYADARVGRYRRQSISTRERQVTGVSDSESYGLGVRTLVDGSWGFAATSTMTREGAQRAAADAVAMSRAARIVRRHRVELAPVKPVTGTWMTPVRRDPIEVPLEEKIALLLAANEAALKVPTVRFASSSLSLLREVKTLVTTEGTNVTQTLIRVGPTFSATAIGDDGEFQVYEHELAPRGSGLGVRRVARHAGQRGPVGVARGREGQGEKRRGRPVRSDSRSDEPLAHDP